MNAKPLTKLGSGLLRLEELEPRAMLTGNGFAIPFVETGGAFFAAAHSAQVPSVAPLSDAFRRDNVASTEFSSSFATFGGNRRGDDRSGGGDSSSSGEFTASLSDSAGDTATVTYQTGDLLGTTESVIAVTGDTLDEGTSVALSINGTSIGTVAINSSGTGTLIVPTSNLSTTVAAGSTITLGTALTGTFAASTTGTTGDHGDSGGCGDSGGTSSSGTNLSASVSDSVGDTATVTYQTGKLLGTSESVITVTGDTLDEGTSVALTINGASVGTIAIHGSGAGSLIVPTSNLSTSNQSTTIVSGSTVTLGTSLNGTFASSTVSNSASSDHVTHETVELAPRQRGRG